MKLIPISIRSAADKVYFSRFWKKMIKKGVCMMSYQKFWEQIGKHNDELVSLYKSYWSGYSNMGDWQFWATLLLFIFPLIVVYFAVDKKRIFELFFFGFVVHLLWTYIDITLGRLGLFTHHYFLMPILPNATTMTASVLPVSFLLLYQYCTNHQKNFYVYTLILSSIFAFGFASFERVIGFISLGKGMHLYHVFMIDVGIVYISYWFTKFIIGLREKAEE